MKRGCAPHLVQAGVTGSGTLFNSAPFRQKRHHGCDPVHI